MRTYTEIKPESSRAYGKGCVGCINNERDIMLSFYEKYGDIFHDVLLTQADAEQLYKELGQAIESNKAKP